MTEKCNFEFSGSNEGREKQLKKQIREILGQMDLMLNSEDGEKQDTVDQKNNMEHGESLVWSQMTQFLASGSPVRNKEEMGDVDMESRVITSHTYVTD